MKPPTMNNLSFKYQNFVTNKRMLIELWIYDNNNNNNNIKYQYDSKT